MVVRQMSESGTEEAALHWVDETLRRQTSVQPLLHDDGRPTCDAEQDAQGASRLLRTDLR